jgi:YVTN family beta-propeller protein
LAVTPNGSKVYVANKGDSTVSVIHTATNNVVGSPIPVGGNPFGVAVTPDNKKVYVTNSVGDGTVSVIDTATNTVVATIPVGPAPRGLAVTPDGRKVYVASVVDSTVSVIDTKTNTVVGSPITVGTDPEALGLFIQPALVFLAGTQLTVYPNTRRFTITNSYFTLPRSGSLNPRPEPVTLQVGSFSITIPPNSFVPGDLPGQFDFSGVIDNVELVVSIVLSRSKTYSFNVEARNVSLTAANPLTLTIGNESGTTTVTPVVINTR